MFLDNFFYQVSGNPSGPKLVFLHGVMGYSQNWRRIALAFAETHHVLVFDQRGHGKSFKPEWGYLPSDFADDLLGIIDELGWQKINLVGHSMGGRNAINFASRYSDRLERVIIEDISPEASFESIAWFEKLFSFIPTPFSSKLEAKRFFEVEFESLPLEVRNPKTLALYLYANITELSDGRSDWRFSKDAILDAIRGARSSSHWGEWEQISNPLLVVRGSDSKDLTLEQYAEMLRRNPRAKGEVISDAGHWVHFDQPEEFISVLKAFLSE